METPSSLLAEKIIERLAREGLLERKDLERFKLKLADGKARPEDWRLAIELAGGKVQP